MEYVCIFCLLNVQIDSIKIQFNSIKCYSIVKYVLQLQPAYFFLIRCYSLFHDKTKSNFQLYALFKTRMQFTRNMYNTAEIFCTICTITYSSYRILDVENIILNNSMSRF